MLFGIGAVLLWSTVATGFKLGLRELAPLELLWLGAVTSFVFFAAASLVTGRWPAIRALSGRDWLRLGALGLLNPFLYYLILFEAYARLPAQIAQPLNYTWAITLAAARDSGAGPAHVVADGRRHARELLRRGGVVVAGSRRWLCGCQHRWRRARARQHAGLGDVLAGHRSRQ